MVRSAQLNGDRFLFGTAGLIYPLQPATPGTDPREDYSVVPGVVPYRPGISLVRGQVFDAAAGGGVHPLELRNVRGIRVSLRTADQDFTGYLQSSHSSWAPILGNLHLYGAPEEETLSDFLQIQPPDRDEEVTTEYLDWGNVQIQSSEDRSVRIKNMSKRKTAEGITIGFSPPLLPLQLVNYPEMFLVSLDGRTWTESVELSALGPLGRSREIFIRRVTGPEFPEGVGTVTLQADVRKWI